MDIMQEILKEVQLNSQEMQGFQQELSKEVQLNSQEIQKFQQEMSKEIQQVRLDLRGEMNQMNNRLTAVEESVQSLEESTRSSIGKLDTRLTSCEESIQSLEESIQACREFQIVNENTWFRKVDLALESLAATNEQTKNHRERISKLEERVSIHDIKFEAVDKALSPV